jgi:phosphatidate cytidylyltransferase
LLKTRILTALVLIPLLVAALFYLPPGWVAVLFGVFIAAAAWEWITLSGIRPFPGRAAYVFFLLVFGGAAIYGVNAQSTLALPFFSAAALWWLWSLADLIRHPVIDRGMFSALAGRLAGGALVLVPPWVAAVYLLITDAGSPWMLLYLFVLVWVADTAAYFAGSVFGKTRLAPHVSPGKTVEGAAGGVLGVVLLAWLCGTMAWHLESWALARWIGLAVVTALFSIAGDLTESKLKRIAGVKDSGSLIPGHGGVLDRIDALTAAMPVFVLGILVLMKF